MTEQAKHTPLPWSASEMEMSRNDWAALNPTGGTLQIIKHGADVIAAVWAEDGIEEKDNAEFITRACNAHDDLVATLQLLQGFDFRLDDSPHGKEIRRRALAVLAKAESRP